MSFKCNIFINKTCARDKRKLFLSPHTAVATSCLVKMPVSAAKPQGENEEEKEKERESRIDDDAEDCIIKKIEK